MKAVCICNSKPKSNLSKFEYLNNPSLDKYDLTIGKVYEIYELHEFAPRILPKKCKVIDDFRKNIHVPFDFFKPIDEIRNEQIEQILK